MLGALIGDMVGAPYEFGESMKRKKFPVFIRRTHFTDDTVMTCAVADASSAAQYANASWSDTFTRLPANCWSAGERPMPHAFAR